MEVEAKAGEAPVETPEQFIARRDAAIAKWLSAKETLASVKPMESEAREAVTAILFPNPKKGTNRYHLNGGYAIKLVHGTNYTLGDKDKITGEGEDAVKVPIADQVREVLAKIYHHCIAAGISEVDAVQMHNDLINWKPELNEKAYLALDPENNVQGAIKSMIDEILTTKPASPQLTFETPKEK